MSPSPKGSARPPELRRSGERSTLVRGAPFREDFVCCVSRVPAILVSIGLILSMNLTFTFGSASFEGTPRFGFV